MEWQIHYDNFADKQTKVTEQEALGRRQIYDNFDDPNWKQGDPMIDTMTFTDVIPPSPVITVSPDVVALKAYLADPHSGLPDLEMAFQALSRLFLGR